MKLRFHVKFENPADVAGNADLQEFVIYQMDLKFQTSTVFFLLGEYFFSKVLVYNCLFLIWTNSQMYLLSFISV